MIVCLLFLYLLTTVATAQEELIVRLPDQTQLSSICILPTHHKSPLQSSYLSQLEQVIRFDLNHNGYSKVYEMPPTVLTATKQPLDFASLKNFKQLHYDFVLKMEIIDHCLSVSCLSTQTGHSYTINEFLLSGQENKDRQICHQLANKLQEMLFHKPGICNTRFLFTGRVNHPQDSSQWVNEIWEADYDGGNARQLTHHQGLCVTPSYIPIPEKQSHFFLYVCYQTGQPKIYAASIDTGESYQLTRMPGNQLMPIISPTGNHMAFINDMRGNPDLFIQKFSFKTGLCGQPQPLLGSHWRIQGSPTFSPDGKQLAFVSDKNGTPRLYITKVPDLIEEFSTESPPKLISKKFRNNTSPAWSPDGSKIAYSASVAGVQQICVYHISTGEETPITTSPEHKENPSWAPDSLHLIFNSFRSKKSELFLINLHESTVVKLAPTIDEARFPSWGNNAY